MKMFPRGFAYLLHARGRRIVLPTLRAMGHPLCVIKWKGLYMTPAGQFRLTQEINAGVMADGFTGISTGSSN